jgi:hypothetical protein
MDGFQVEGRPEDAGNPVARPQVSQPRPRAETFDRDDTSITRRRHALEDDLGAGLEVLMPQELPSGVQEADVNRPGVESDATVGLMLGGVKAHEVSSASA